MFRSAVLALSAACAWALASAPAPAAVKLKPGAYKLEWRIPDFEGSLFSVAARLAPVDQSTAARFEGLASRRACWGSAERYTVVLDESGGPGSGYDTLYVVADAAADAGIDLRQAASVRLAAVENSGDVVLLPADESVELRVHIGIGPPDARVSKPVAIDCEIACASEEGKSPVPELACLMVRGGWHGYVDTDYGRVRVRTVDSNGNGVYNDPRTEESDADSVVRTRLSSFLGESEELGKAGCSTRQSGKLYEVDISALGDVVEFRPYDGPTGTLTIAVEDAAGKPATCESLKIEGTRGSFDCAGETRVLLPAGEYDSVTGTIACAPDPKTRRPLWVCLTRESPVSISKDAVTDLKLGGPLTVTINQGSEFIAARRGADARINLTFSAGDCGVDFMGARPAVVNIRDSKGKLVHHTTAPFG